MHQFTTEQWLPVDISLAWNFFSSPMNLAKITPPEMAFKVLSNNLPEKIYDGLLIDYTVKPLFGIEMKWQTKITDVAEQKYFTDKQLKGPYKIWEHTHYFEEKNNGVLMTDVVNYQLPMGVLGLIINRLIVRPRIAAIFKFRKETLNTLFAP